MNFFQSLCGLQIPGDWTIAIKQLENNRLIVTVLLTDPRCGDTAQKLIAPLKLEGTPQEFDDGIIEMLRTPMKATAGLTADMEHYMKQLEQARLSAEMEKGKQEQQRKEADEKKKKYEAALKKAADLEAEGKHREAWMAVPEPGDYPEQAEMLRKRKSELSAKFQQPTFF